MRRSFTIFLIAYLSLCGQIKAQLSFTLAENYSYFTYLKEEGFVEDSRICMDSILCNYPVNDTLLGEYFNINNYATIKRIPAKSLVCLYPSENAIIQRQQEKFALINRMPSVKGTLLYKICDSLDRGVIKDYGILDGTLMDYYKNKSKYTYKKNVYLATVLSLFPGMGKVYLGKTGDGIFSFMAVGLYSFMSYRGFYLRGNKSVPGYFYGLLAVSFYSGSIYGTIKEYKRSKNALNDNRRIEFEEAVYTYSGFLH